QRAVQFSSFEFLSSNQKPVSILNSDSENVHSVSYFINFVRNSNSIVRSEPKFPGRIKRRRCLKPFSVSSWSVWRHSKFAEQKAYSRPSEEKIAKRIYSATGMISQVNQ